MSIYTENIDRVNKMLSIIGPLSDQNAVKRKRLGRKNKYDDAFRKKVLDYYYGVYDYPHTFKNTMNTFGICRDTLYRFIKSV